MTHRSFSCSVRVSAAHAERRHGSDEEAAESLAAHLVVLVLFLLAELVTG
jgi:hypothetical protein